MKTGYRLTCVSWTPGYRSTRPPSAGCSAANGGAAWRAACCARGSDFAHETLGVDALRIEAQTYARRLYEKAGFRQVSEEFLEDGIPHIQMLLDWE